MGNGRDDLFACTVCGSPSIALPPVLTPAATVCCGGCGRALMSWDAFRERAEAAVGRRKADRAADTERTPAFAD